MNKLLIIEDTISDQIVIKDFLSELYDLIFVNTLDRALDEIAKGGLIGAFSKLKLFSRTGIEIVAALRIANATLPIIILTDGHTGESEVELLKLGADDYLLKKDIVNKEILIRALCRATFRHATTLIGCVLYSKCSADAEEAKSAGCPLHQTVLSKKIGALEEKLDNLSGATQGGENIPPSHAATLEVQKETVRKIDTLIEETGKIAAAVSEGKKEQ